MDIIYSVYKFWIYFGQLVGTDSLLSPKPTWFFYSGTLVYQIEGQAQINVQAKNLFGTLEYPF